MDVSEKSRFVDLGIGLDARPIDQIRSALGYGQIGQAVGGDLLEKMGTLGRIGLKLGNTQLNNGAGAVDIIPFDRDA